ncbi:hypothetical protein EJD97_022472, partial [Solanum chilense]
KLTYMPNMLEEENKKKEDAKRNKKSSGEDQGDSSKNILENKQKEKLIYGNKESNSQLFMKERKDADNHEQQIIHGEFESLGEDNHYGATIIENNTVNTCLYPLLPACEKLQSEKFKVHSKSNISRNQKDSFVEEILGERQEEIIDGT